MKISSKIKKNALKEIEKRTLNLDSFKDAWLEKVALPTYLNAQRERFKKENASELFVGGRWKNLDKKYQILKRKKYASYAGRGTKTNIATGRLLRSLLIESSEGRKMIRSGKMLIGSVVPYAQHVDDVRTISRFSTSFVRDLGEKFSKYVKKVLIKGK